MKKIAFLDVDGTLTTGISSWEKVHLHFNLKKEMQENSQRYFNGEINYDEWASLDVNLWKGKSIEELESAVNPPELIKGASEGVSRLKDAGYMVILLSGGIDIMVNSVKNLVSADDAYSNVIGHTDGLVDGSIQLTVGDKSKTIRQLVKDRNYNLENSIAIGDNFNDRDMFALVDYSIAFNPKDKKLEDMADHVVYSDNFVDAVNKIIERDQ